MSFYEHLDELRVRLLRCLWVFLLGFAVAYLFAEPMLEVLRRPLFKVLPPDPHGFDRDKDGIECEP